MIDMKPVLSSENLIIYYRNSNEMIISLSRSITCYKGNENYVCPKERAQLLRGMKVHRKGKPVKID